MRKRHAVWPISMGTFVLGLGCAALTLGGLSACVVETVPEGTQLDEESALGQALSPGERHPYQTPLICERAPGSSLVGVMYDVRSGEPDELARFRYGGNVGDCELALRASRNGRVCVPGSWFGFTVHDLATGERSGSYSQLGDCTAVTLAWPELTVDAGYMEWIAREEVDPFRAILPALSDPLLDEALHDPLAIWYDEASAVFVYQDSFGDPKGLRANRVGYDVGSNSSVPDIHALVEYFQPQKFKFPFSVAAGATFAENVYARYFWLPPRDDDNAARAVRVWKNNSHWQWVFPVGTVLGEVLHIQAPDGAWFVFEVRTRTRLLDSWETAVFRPFTSAAEVAEAVRELRPQWADAPDVAALVEHLEAEDSLEPHVLEAPSYELLFPPLEGAMDYLPAVEDVALIQELLAQPMFVDTMGTHWKASGELMSFAASTHADFHIVPKEYPAGMFELTEAGCKMCHDQTSRPLNNLDSRVVLYGEVWGEDEIFTWHPFAINARSFGVGDGNRSVNLDLVESGLVEFGQPPAESFTYRVLEKPYAPIYE